MKLASLLILIAAVSVSQVSGADWAYPATGQTSHGESGDGTGNFHTYQALTKDKPEKVALWYAEKLGLGENHSLVKAAEAGFDQLDTLAMYEDQFPKNVTEQIRRGLFLSTLSAEYASVQIFVQPEIDSANTISISITQTPNGTAISVIQSFPKQTVTKAN